MVAVYVALTVTWNETEMVLVAGTVTVHFKVPVFDVTVRCRPTVSWRTWPMWPPRWSAGAGAVSVTTSVPVAVPVLATARV